MVSVPADPPRGGDMHVVVMPDGARIRTAAWRPTGTPRATIILLNGRTEFIEKYHEVISELVARDLAVWTCDWRGQGLSSRSLDNPHKSHIADYVSYLDDLNTLLDSDLPEYAVEPRLALAHSMGGHLALRILQERPGAFAACVLSAPLIDLPTGMWLGRPTHALCRAGIQA
ncbi:MAG: alpha/beta hydrolase, partial [Alphaproteobacteria bacterium]